MPKYRKITFDKEIAFKNPDSEFLSFGHPLFEATLKWIEKYLYDDLLKGGVFYDPDKKLNGEILYYEGTVKDGRGKTAGKRLFAYYIDNKTGEIKEINPSIIWDLKPTKAKSNDVEIEELKNKALNTTILSLNNYKQDLTKERERQAKIKEKYGIKSLEYLINKLNDELLELEARKMKGEDVDLAIRNKEERRRKYEKALQKLKEEEKIEVVRYIIPLQEINKKGEENV